MSVRYVAEAALALLAVASREALQHLDTSAYPEGTLCYVRETNQYFSFQTFNWVAANGLTVLSASLAGLWVECLAGNVVGGGGGGGGGSAATPTRITAAGTTLTTAQTLVYANTSGGAFTVTMPATPTDGLTVEFVDDHYSWDTKNLTVNANSGQQIVDLSQVAGTFAGFTKLTAKGGAVTFQYDLSQTRWVQA